MDANNTLFMARTKDAGEKREIELEELRHSERGKDRVLAAIYDRQGELYERTSKIETNISEITRAIHGDEKNKQPGLIELTHKNHARIKRLEKLAAYGTGVIATVGVLWDALKGKFFGNY